MVYIVIDFSHYNFRKKFYVLTIICDDIRLFRIEKNYYSY
jgi:hypothetical protein